MAISRKEICMNKRMRREDARRIKRSGCDYRVVLVKERIRNKEYKREREVKWN